MTSERPLDITVLGDVHGHLTLAYRLLRRWERETGRTLDLTLQVGDLGAFPPPFRLDRATKRFAESVTWARRPGSRRSSSPDRERRDPARCG